MSNLLIYPYCRMESSLWNYAYLCETYDRIEFVCLDSMFESEKKMNYKDNRNVVLTNDYESALENCDEVLILDNFLESIKDTYVQKIQLALAKNKKVRLSKAMLEACQEEFSDISNLYILDNEDKNDNSWKERVKKIVQPKIPVITITSFGENCCKFEAQLEMRRRFLERGYKVLQFGTKNYSSIFGFEQLPSFLFSAHISLANKVYMLNYYMNKKILEEKYDVVILGVPGSIVPFNEYEPYYFGELPIVISQALQIDINILCNYHNEKLEDKNLVELREFCKNKLNCYTDYFYMSDTQYRVKVNKIVYIALDKPYCMKTLPHIPTIEGILFCHTLQDEEKDVFFTAIIEELEENIEIV